MAGAGRDSTHRDNGAGVEDGRRSWVTLAPEQRAGIIALNVQEVFRYGDHAAEDIVRTAREDFRRDFSEIRSKRMRLAVLRSLGEVPEVAHKAEAGLMLALPSPTPPDGWRNKLNTFVALFFG
jgi:hypothetical protein